MFCSNCGKEVNENNSFCSSCGYSLKQSVKNIDENKSENTDEQSFRNSVFLIGLTSPLNLIIRMICQDEGVRYSWREYTYYYVPTSMKVVMFMLTIIMIISGIYLNKQSNEVARKKLIVLSVISFLISAFIIMMEW